MDFDYKSDSKTEGSVERYWEINNVIIKPGWEMAVGGRFALTIILPPVQHTEVKVIKSTFFELLLHRIIKIWKAFKAYFIYKNKPK